MKQRKVFAKRVLTFMLSLAMVMTSITMPGMTAMAAQEPTGESVERPVSVTATWDATDSTIDVSWGQNQTMSENGYTYRISVTGEGYSSVKDDLLCTPISLPYDTESNEGEAYTVGATYTVEVQSKFDGNYSVVDESCSVEVIITEAEDPEPVAPGAPAALTVEQSGSGIRVLWGAGQDATGYLVTITGGEGDDTYVQAYNEAGAADKVYEYSGEGGYKVGVTYTVTVQSVNGELKSEITEATTGTVTIEDMTEAAPSAPDGVVAAKVVEGENAGKVRVAWANIEGNGGTPTKWIVYYYTAETAENPTKAGEVEFGNDTQFFVETEGLEAGEYTFAVSAYNEAGESAKTAATSTITIEAAAGGEEPTPAEDSYVLVSEQIEQAKVNEDITLTWQSNDEDFEFVADGTTVRINGEKVFSVVFGETITIPAANFAAAGVYEITFEVEGYDIPAVYQTVYATDTTDDWTLVWSDEFSGDELDSSKWDHQTGIGDAYTDAGWGNNEEQYYTDGDNTTVGGGKLTITAKKEATEGYGTKYTSSRLRTVTEVINEETGKAEPGEILVGGKGAMAYGKIEAKIKMPTGNGIWPAFWMLPHDSQYGGWAAGGEIDIVEAKGRIPNQIVGTIHHGGAWPNNVNTGLWTKVENGGAIDQYHIYTVEWDPDEMRWYLDEIGRAHV